jgi:hypothetical protein
MMISTVFRSPKTENGILLQIPWPACAFSHEIIALKAGIK